MKAAVIAQGGVTIAEVPRPHPASTDVLVQVHAAGLNRADLLSVQRGEISHSASTITSTEDSPPVLGHEFAGEVVEVGAEVRNIEVGDRVMGLGYGAHAEFALADAGLLYQIPQDMSYGHGASLPLALLTVYNSLLLAGRLREGESVLVHGASSSVGLMTMQVARLIGASMIVGTSTTQIRRDKLAVYGADIAVDSNTPTWPTEVLAVTGGGRGVDLVIDQVAGPSFNQTMEAACLGARIVNVGRLGGMQGEFNFDLHARKRLEYIGVTFRTRTLDDYRAVTNGIRAVLWPAVVRNRLSMPINRTFALDEAPEAYRFMDRNGYFGKILIAP